MVKQTIISLLLLCMPLSLMAQRHTINGYVTDTETGERLIGATVLDTLSRQGTVTNQAGYYALTLTDTTTVLQISYVGYQPVEVTVGCSTDTLMNILLNASTTLSEVTVVGHQSISGPQSVQMSAVEVPINQIKGIPAIGGEVDILKALQLLPGVQSGTEGSAGLYVRGGGPEENLIMLDGVPLYSVNHMLGFFSVFNADAVKNVTLYKGNFPARFGSRLSSVVDVRQNDGNQSGIHGNITIGPIAGKVCVEGPVQSKKGNTTFNLSARRTLYDLFTSPLIALATKVESDMPTWAGYYFWDVNAKLTHTFNDNDKLSATFYMGEDVIYARMKDASTDPEDIYKEKMNMRWNWGNILAAVNHEHRFNANLFSTAQLSFTRYKYNLSVNMEETANDVSVYGMKIGYYSNIMDVMFQDNFEWRPSNRHAVRFGCHYTYHMFSPEVQRFALDVNDAELTYNLDTTLAQSGSIPAHEAALYIEDSYTPISWLTMNIGARASLYHVSGKTYPSIEPRVGLRALLYKDLAFKASYSYMSQYVHLLSSTSVSLPTDLWVPVTDKIDPMRSMQVAAGFSYNILGQVEMSVEGYYKYMTNLLEYADGATYLSSRGWQDQVCLGDGWSYGVEVLLQRRVGPVTGWIGYTWSRTMRQFNREGQEINFGNPFHAKYDREHDLSVTLQWEINKKWTLSGTFIYGSGTRGTFGLQKYVDPIYYGTGSYSGETVYAVEERNNFQMPDYHRLDLGATWQEPLKKHPTMSNMVNISIYNVYNHQNAFLVYPRNNQLYQLSLFPIMPSVSYSFRF